MGNFEPLFSIDEVKAINSTIDYLYGKDLPLTDFTDFFMDSLRGQIYFDKSDFMFFQYNNETKLYEMQSFCPINWSDSEIEHYIRTYMHMDDVLPILSQSQEIAFRNSDIFSLAERKKTKYYQEFVAPAHLEISIDANIPLTPKSNTFAILGLFRNPEKRNFR